LLSYSYRLQGLTPNAAIILAGWWQEVFAIVDSANRREINSFIILVARSIWLERNTRVFDRSASMPIEVNRKIKVQMEQWKVAKLCGQSRGI
jgi:hypothetical protein